MTGGAGDEDDDDIVYVDGKKKKKVKIWGKLELHSDEKLKETPNQNFYLLSSVGVFDNPINVNTKKAILKKFNQRPENSQGEEVRFIIMDSGFKEGIDLFDIKYIHIFEPQVTAADQKQVIGRGTRTCGQKGLTFHPTQGWPLYVFIYDLSIPANMQPSFLQSKSTFDFYLKSLNIDLRLYNFMDDLEKASILGSVDYDLNKNIHNFAIKYDDSPEPSVDASSVQSSVQSTDALTVQSSVQSSAKSGSTLWSSLESNESSNMSGGGPKRNIIVNNALPPIIVNTLQDSITAFPTMPIISHRPNFQETRDLIAQYYSSFAWTDVKMENMCEEKMKGGASHLIQYTPTQDFIKHFFTPTNPCKGMLLWHSVGTGKTCSAIAAATSTFERQGYTILWVTRTTLKNDIWKNMYDQVCNENIRNMIERGIDIPNDHKKRMKLLSKSWKIRPMSYKQFSNLVSKQNNLYNNLVKINGSIDPLRKTLLIIDEAHKLYGGNDLSSLERPNMEKLCEALIHSYNVSGNDSVRLLLMTATPITQNPMELIKLVNLCKPFDEQMPSEFDSFSSDYLLDDGSFSVPGKRRYLDDIAGYISYLNREKDARQFSQPRIQFIRPSITKNLENSIQKFGRKCTF